MTLKIKGSKRSSGWMEYGLPERPDGPVPKMPWDIGEVSDSQLMKLFSEFTAWANFLSVEVANAATAEEEVEDRIRYFINGYIVASGKVQAARAEAEGTDDMKDMRTELRTKKHRRKLIDAMFENATRSATACSRELSRRLAAGPVNARAGKYDT